MRPSPGRGYVSGDLGGHLHDGRSRPGRLPFNYGSLPSKGESGNALVYVENDRSDIHGYAERVRRYLALIAESNLPDEDKKALVEFSEVLRAQGLHIGRVMMYLYHLRVCAENITELSDTPSLKAADARAITKLVAWL